MTHGQRFPFSFAQTCNHFSFSTYFCLDRYALVVVECFFANSTGLYLP